MRKILLCFFLLLILAACSPGEVQIVSSPDVEISSLPTQTVSPTPLPELTAETGETPAGVSPESPTPETPPTQTATSEPEGRAAAQVLPDPAAYDWVEVANGFVQPLDLADPGDGSGRLFVVSQRGQIWIIHQGQRLDTPFLDLSDRTTRPNLTGYLGEQGLLGLAFHPRFSENGYFYVNYTDRDGDTHISRFSVSAQDLNRADPDSELELLFVDQPYPNHNGGGLAFGPDGYLYIALGDGGSAGDPLGNGQSLDTLLGKILRVDVDTQQPYGIPPDNPFVNGDDRAEIWAYGLRNPWRIAFDRLTGDLYIADVGQNAYEEINFQAAGSRGGENYGWNYREGAHSFKGTPPEGLSLVDPVAEYSHELGCSVTGGVVYRGADLPAWQGVYLYGDYCSGRIWGLLRDADGNWQEAQLFETNFTISSFGIDAAGEVYVIDYGRGTIYRLAQR